MVPENDELQGHPFTDLQSIGADLQSIGAVPRHLVVPPVVG